MLSDTEKQELNNNIYESCQKIYQAFGETLEYELKKLKTGDPEDDFITFRGTFWNSILMILGKTLERMPYPANIEMFNWFWDDINEKINIGIEKQQEKLESK